MTMEILKATRFHVAGASDHAEYQGVRKDGRPKVRREALWHEEGMLFLADPGTAAALIAAGDAKPANLSGDALRLAHAVLPAETPLGAALAGLSARAAVWHAERDEGGHWRPVRASGGLMRGAFDTRFRDVAEAAALWAERPDATPLLSILTEHGFRRAFIWRGRALHEIATQVFTMEG